MSAQETRKLTPPGPYARKALYVLTTYWCPYCGKQDMWQEANDTGDYYMGVETWCLGCNEKTYNLDEQNQCE